MPASSIQISTSQTKSFARKEVFIFRDLSGAKKKIKSTELYAWKTNMHTFDTLYIDIYIDLLPHKPRNGNSYE